MISSFASPNNVSVQVWLNFFNIVCPPVTLIAGFRSPSPDQFLLITQ